MAAALHISRANVYTRVARLEQAGVITGYAATIDPQRFGYGVSAYVYLKITQQSWKALHQRLLSIPAVEHCALVAGEYDIVLLVRAADVAALRDVVVMQLQDMPEVRSTHTVIIFDEVGRGAGTAHSQD